MLILNLKHFKSKAELLTKHPNAVYCGRPSALGNPFPITSKQTRKASIDKYRRWLYHELTVGNKEVIRAIENLKEDSILYCFCVPLPCHCEIIEAAWRWWISIQSLEDLK